MALAPTIHFEEFARRDQSGSSIPEEPRPKAPVEPEGVTRKSTFLPRELFPVEISGAEVVFAVFPESKYRLPPLTALQIQKSHFSSAGILPDRGFPRLQSGRQESLVENKNRPESCWDFEHVREFQGKPAKGMRPRTKPRFRDYSIDRPARRLQSHRGDRGRARTVEKLLSTKDAVLDAIKNSVDGLRVRIFL